MSAGSSGELGHGGPGAPEGFGDTRDVRECFDVMVPGIRRLQEIEDHVEHDLLNFGKYIKKIGKVSSNIFRALGRKLEQQSMRYISIAL